MRFKISILVTKILVFILRHLKGGGTTLPGRVGLLINPLMLEKMTENMEIVLITGTNGKTTTGRILSAIFKQAGICHITNSSGANLSSGIATALSQAFSFKGKQRVATALIEIDELALIRLGRRLNPRVILVTNFFKDQIDRLGDIYDVVERMREAIMDMPNIQLVLNGDDALCVRLAEGQESPPLFYGIDNQDWFEKGVALCPKCKSSLNYSYVTYGHLGHFSCAVCGHTRPHTPISIREMKNRTSRVLLKYGDEFLDTTINLPGIYNIYNGLAASACAFYWGIESEAVVSGLSTFKGGFGRMESIRAGNKFIELILVKNPAGFNQAVEHLILMGDRLPVAFVINARGADGRDITWLWDTDGKRIKKLASVSGQIFVSGIRARDMMNRLKGEDCALTDLVMEKNYSRLIERGLLKTPPGKTFYILPNYTAMLDLRKVLKRKYPVKDLWE